ncbi:MAG: molecular chaperone HtpG [Clostridiales bacterium]
MAREQGSVSVNTDNIFPIIKKWLYSEKEIFIRELVSNANDAIVKLQKLTVMGNADVSSEEKYKIKVIVNNDDKTIKIVDNGIGMTDEEVKKYINQIAFSGAQDFFEKYKDKADESQIIGHFGLGFYSSFMVADKVEIDTLSYQEGAEAVKWVSDDGTDYSIDNSDKTERGTTITLYLNEDSHEYVDEFKMKGMLNKYFSFLAVELYLEDSTKKEEVKKEEIKDDQKQETTEDNKEESTDEQKEDVKDEVKEVKEEPLNDTKPLWLKAAKDCTDEEYKEFYKKVFSDFNEPLFWIHINMDYPFNMKGILYFPKLKHEFETMEGQIKLYYNQVFVADNVKEVIPEFLLLLKGTLDCPDLPLNVSRSFLQNDGYVNKISAHITKKVADKLKSLHEKNNDDYKKYWDDINPFVKYGCIKEQKFYDKVKDIILFKTINDEYVTLKEYLEKNESKHKDSVYYVSDEKQQSQYIKMFKENEMDAVILPSMIDNHFIQHLEMKESGTKFNRIDAEISSSLKDESIDEKEVEKLTKTLDKMFKDSLANDKLKVKVESLKSENVPGMILLSEQSRRMQEMSRSFGGGMDMGHMFPQEETLVLNSKNSLIQSVLDMEGIPEKKEDIKLVCQQVYDLALMSHKQMEPDQMSKFIERSNELLKRLVI